MADNPSQTLETRSSASHGDDGDEEEVEELEMLELEVKQMAETILHYRTTLPDQFKKTFASLLVSQRPVVPHFNGTSEPGISGDRNPDAGEHVESSKGALQPDEDPETAEKIRLLKLKISSNVSAMPTILKRMNDCISMIDKLDKYKGTMHPVFKKRRTS